MIEKNWSDIEIYNYCKQNKVTEEYNKGSKKIPYLEFITSFTALEDKKFMSIKSWAIDNCNGYWKVCKFHPGYENHIVFKFSYYEDFLAFSRFYDKLMYPKIDVLM